MAISIFANLASGQPGKWLKWLGTVVRHSILYSVQKSVVIQDNALCIAALATIAEIAARPAAVEALPCSQSRRRFDEPCMLFRLILEECGGHVRAGHCGSQNYLDLFSAFRHQAACPHQHVSIRLEGFPVLGS